LAERIALTLGLSVFLLPGLGLILNFSPFGITLGSVTVSAIVFSAMASLVLWHRRKEIPENMQFPPHLELTKTLAPTRSSRIAVALYFGIAVVLVGIIYMLILFATEPQPVENFTEFYILTDDGEMVEKPVQLAPGELKHLMISISNHEGEAQNYALHLRSLEFTGRWAINDSANSFLRYPTATNIGLNTSYIDSLQKTLLFSGNGSFVYNFTMDDDETLENEFGIFFTHPGNYRFQLELYRSEESTTVPDVWLYVIIIVN
jgi:uncharacterized membrane protein